VSAGLGIGRGIHSHDFKIRIRPSADPTPQHIATNSAESIDGNAQGHGRNKRSYRVRGFGAGSYRIYWDFPVIDLPKNQME
jgi:hypothetical protein